MKGGPIYVLRPKLRQVLVVLCFLKPGLLAKASRMVSFTVWSRAYVFVLGPGRFGGNIGFGCYIRTVSGQSSHEPGFLGTDQWDLKHD